MKNSQAINLNQLDSRIRSVWGRAQILHFFAGLLIFLRWSAPLFLLGVFIDWMTYMPSTGRFIILFALLAISSYKAWLGGWRHMRSFDAHHMALQLESFHGDLNSLLISALQFRDIAQASGTDNSMHNRTYLMAEEAASSLEPSQAVPYNPLRRLVATALALSVVIAVLAIINGPFMGVGMQRIFCPWVTTAYPTNTQIELMQDELVLKEGEKGSIQASLSGVIPEDATILIRTGENAAREIDLKVSDAICTYTIDSASRDFMYRIKAGDDRTDWNKVRVVPAPRVEKVNVDVLFPDYLNRDKESIEALTLTVPEGSKLNWKIILDQAISSAIFHRDGEDPIALQVSEDGKQVTLSQAVTASRGYSFSWIEKENNFKFKSPRYYLQVASDQAPRVELTSPETNLVAMLGRQLTLKTRVQDDHGIGSTAIIYRLNKRDDVKVKLNLSSKSVQEEQSINWDYRKALTDLKTGDTVSFSLEASDSYPGENGPHTVRSETRRITFLSKEDYLEQIQKKKDRLLSRVHTMYRQQRAAFENVRNLDPDEDSYMQACQVEAIRQELVREQLKEIANQVGALLNDLAANKASDAPEAESLEQVRSALLVIADTHMANAASRLRHQSGVAGNDTKETPDPAAAARTVNTAARELASLVMLRSIDTAQEVYAREAHMIAQIQASLRWRTVENESSEVRVTISKEQTELAQWTQRLISDLQNGMRYEKRPLAVLRLIQSVKDLQRNKTEERMRQAAALVTQGKVEQAEPIQAELISTLLDAEFSVRLTGAYSTLIKTRNQMRFIVKSQGLLRKECAAMSAQIFKKSRTQAAQAQKKLRKRLLTLLLPTVPASRPQLLDETFPQPPLIQALLKSIDQGMVDTMQQLIAGKQDATISKQQQTEQELTRLMELVNSWSVEMGLQTLGLSTLVAVSGERLSLIEEFEAKLIGLLEKTDTAAAEKQKVDGLAEPQLILIDELSAFNKDLMTQNQTVPDKDIPPLLSRTKLAEQILRKALAELKKNSADQAIEFQGQAADIFAEAFTIVTKQNEQLSLLQSLLMFQRSVGFANGYMSDIVDQQRDMIVETKGFKTENTSKIMPLLGNLRSCVEAVAPLLDLVATRLDAGSPLAFAATDLEDAVTSLKSGDKVDSLDAQDVAAESLEKVQSLVLAIKSETGYIAEIVEFLHTAVAEIALLEYQQEELKRKISEAKPTQLKALIEQQRQLFNKTQKNGEVIELVTGGIPAYADLIKAQADKLKGKEVLEVIKEMPAYTEPAKLMHEALAKLQSNEATAAVEQMELASMALKGNTESLFTVITMLHGLPNIDMSLHTEPGVKRLVNVLAVASEQKILFRKTNDAKPDTMKAFAKQQGEITSRLEKLLKVGETHEMLNTAFSQLTAATKAMQSSDQKAIMLSQHAAVQTLRHFIIEQALILETAAPAPAASDGSPTDSGEGSDTEEEFSAGFISDFVSGEAPKDQRSGWKLLGERNRAALNQNFARELPLEYRGLLKNYYERVTK